MILGKPNQKKTFFNLFGLRKYKKGTKKINSNKTEDSSTESCEFDPDGELQHSITISKTAVYILVGPDQISYLLKKYCQHYLLML